MLVIFQSKRCRAHVAGQIEANRKGATLAVVLIDDGQDVQINQWEFLGHSCIL